MVILALLCCLSLRTSGTSLIPIQSVADRIDYKYPHYCENSRVKVVICMSKDKKSETSEVIPTIFIVLPFKKKKKVTFYLLFSDHSRMYIPWLRHGWVSAEFHSKLNHLYRTTSKLWEQIKVYCWLPVLFIWLLCDFFLYHGGVCWINLGWSLSHAITPLLRSIGQENKMEKLLGQGKDKIIHWLSSWAE